MVDRSFPSFVSVGPPDPQDNPFLVNLIQSAKKLSNDRDDRIKMIW
jgi:hypothetical protein